MPGTFRRTTLWVVTHKGARWWAVPVLAAALLGGIGIGRVGQASAAPVTPATAPATPTAAPPGAATVSGVGTATAVLRQAGDQWETTVLVTGKAGCAQLGSATYWLATTPDGAFGPGRVAGTAAGPGADDCEVTVAFSSLAQVPVSAALVFDQGGTSTSLALTVSRDVTLASYLGIPALAGGIAVLLYLLSLAFVTTYDWGGRAHRLLSPAWWKHSVPASGAWTANDSWATNISTGLVVVATFLAASTASSSLFPGVALDRFGIVNILAGVFVVTAPVLFGILYAYFTGRTQGPSADSVVSVPSNGQVVLRVPSGATITPVATTEVTGGPPEPPVQGGPVASGAQWAPAAQFKTGDAHQVAPYSLITISPPPHHPVTLAFSGTSDIGVARGATVGISPEPQQYDPDDVAADNPPYTLSPAAGAKITVTGTGGLYLPSRSEIIGPRRPAGTPAPAGRWLLLPQGSSVVVGSLGIIVAANILTMFGIGAELGIAFVLAGFSEAGRVPLDCVYAGLGLLAAVVLRYAFSATQAMANPEPGSALSAQAGTSFTL
jgi:hypothetical protein